jgi:hypothetical protein
MIAIKVSGIEDIIEQMKPLTDTRTIARMINRDVAPAIERRLDRVVSEEAPPRDDSKFVWSFNREANKKARRWWFRELKLGSINTDGRHYQRTGVIRNSWQTEISISGDEVILSLFNPAPGSEYLYGSPEQRQVPGHTATGWPNYQRFTAFIDVARTDVIEQWEQLVIKTTSGRR